MLSTHGHTVLLDEEANEAAVWVLDAPGAATLDTLTTQRYSDSPRGAYSACTGRICFALD